MNGTCNFILSEMDKTNDTFQEVLKRAQSLGYAEPGDPKLDINGYDTLAKVRFCHHLHLKKSQRIIFNGGYRKYRTERF